MNVSVYCFVNNAKYFVPTVATALRSGSWYIFLTVHTWYVWNTVTYSMFFLCKNYFLWNSIRTPKGETIETDIMINYVLFYDFIIYLYRMNICLYVVIIQLVCCSLISLFCWSSCFWHCFCSQGLWPVWEVTLSVNPLFVWEQWNICISSVHILWTQAWEWEVVNNMEETILITFIYAVLILLFLI